jgi:hypothetical protein
MPPIVDFQVKDQLNTIFTNPAFAVSAAGSNGGGKATGSFGGKDRDFGPKKVNVCTEVEVRQGFPNRDKPV